MGLVFPDVSPLRKHWLLREGMVFLNHGSFGACPRVVVEAQAKLREEMDAAPLQFLWRGYEGRLDAARVVVADFLGAEASNVAFVSNATAGVNAVLRSLEFRPGDEILTTSHGYHACLNVVAEVARRTGAVMTVAEVPFPIASADEVVEAVLAAVTRRTRLLLIDHVTSNTALVFPVARIVAELEARGIDTLVDGAHAPGMVELELEKLRPAYYAANLHKWVCAPKGTGVLWVREDRQEGIQPVVISHGNDTPRKGHSAFQDRFDWPGTHDPTGWLCAPEAIRFVGSCVPGGWPEVRRRNRELAVAARRLLVERLGVEAPCPEGMLGSMATLPFPGRLHEAAGITGIDPVYAELFDRDGIEVQVIRMEGRRWFRVAAHLHNTLDEYRYLAEVLSGR